jgi:geranylgeranyl pyrophosphate synthase
VLVGDALLTRAFELLGFNGTPNVLAILRTIGRAAGTGGLIGGQVLDLKAAREPRASNLAAWEEIARRKTGALITASVEAGALAGRASAAAQARLRRFGADVGLAFQLKDDLHDGDGMVSVAGAQAVAKRATACMQRARRTLKPFGARAWLLRELTDWLESS